MVVNKTSPDHILADQNERGTPDYAKPLKSLVRPGGPEVPYTRRTEKPKNRKSSPQQAERNHAPVFVVENYRDFGATGPLNRFSGQQLGRKDNEWKGCRHWYLKSTTVLIASVKQSCRFATKNNARPGFTPLPETWVPMATS